MSVVQYPLSTPFKNGKHQIRDIWKHNVAIHILWLDVFISFQSKTCLKYILHYLHFVQSYKCRSQHKYSETPCFLLQWQLQLQKQISFQNLFDLIYLSNFVIIITVSNRASYKQQGFDRSPKKGASKYNKYTIDWGTFDIQCLCTLW